MPKLAIDGLYGPQTAAALKDIQRFWNLPVTGVMDLTTSNILVSKYILQPDYKWNGLMPLPGYKYLIYVPVHQNRRCARTHFFFFLLLFLSNHHLQHRD